MILKKKFFATLYRSDDMGKPLKLGKRKENQLFFVLVICTKIYMKNQNKIYIIILKINKIQNI